MRIISIILIAAVSVAVLSTPASAFENVVYQLGPRNRATGAADTIAVLTWLDVPSLFSPTRLRIDYIPRHDTDDSLEFYLSRGSLCQCDWDHHRRVFAGPLNAGDTVSHIFTLTPLVVGEYNLGVAFVHDDHRMKRAGFHSKFILDEYGKLVREIEEGVRYGSLGLAPEAMGDSIVFVKECFLRTQGKSKQTSVPFGIRTVLHNPFKQGESSRLDVTVTSLRHFGGGMAVYVRHTDQFDVVTLASDELVPGISPGDQFKFSFEVTPRHPGRGKVSVVVSGFHDLYPLKIDNAKRAAHKKAHISMNLALDESLSLIAYKSDWPLVDPAPLEGLPSVVDPRQDSYRESAIEALPKCRDLYEERRVHFVVPTIDE